MNKTCEYCAKIFSAEKNTRFCNASCRSSYTNTHRTKKYPVEYGCKSKLYTTWRAMYARCYRPSHEAYLRYSKLEKAICDEWKNDYIVFLQWSLENGYSDKLQIDRIDNLKGYSPENCRWVTTKIQQSNKQNSLPPMLAFGEYKTPIEWAEDERCVVSRIRLVKRINSGISLEDAITKLKLVRRRNQLSEITKQRMSEKAILQNSNDRRDEISGRYTSYTKLPNQA